MKYFFKSFIVSNVNADVVSEFENYMRNNQNSYLKKFESDPNYTVVMVTDCKKKIASACSASGIVGLLQYAKTDKKLFHVSVTLIKTSCKMGDDEICPLANSF